MESIGRLAGGIAHDFNNLMTPIMGYAQLEIRAQSAENRSVSEMQEIYKAAERASQLTRQLLAFSRGQVMDPIAINVNDLVLNIGPLLRGFTSEAIELVSLPAPDLGIVKVDPAQIEQVLINLVVNAQDAIPERGKIIVETANVTFDEEHARYHVEATSAQYVMLAVTDTGVGMSQQVEAHIFEPFFTTKVVGKGTGLGLSTCYGIVKQNGGHITVDSAPGQGTTISVYLPRADLTVDPLPEPDDSDGLLEGSETVLLVEDEPSVRSVASRILRDQSYTVLEASNGHEALSLARAYAGDEIHLLMTDVVMPLMGGEELAQRLGEIHPETKVLYTSGYTDGAMISNRVPQLEVAFIPKPFTPTVLARKVREVLEQ